MNLTSLISAFGALLYAIFGLRIVWSSIPNFVPLTMLPLSGVLWGVQFLTTAALLAAYARTART